MENKKAVNSCGGGYVNLLWTGGWDSTFRLVELSRQECTVQPVYLHGDGRRSESFERKAMGDILNLLWKRPETKANILPVKYVEIASIPENQEITDAYKRVTENHRLGSQYEWIARYAAVTPGCELCSEKPHPNGIGYMSKLITSEGQIVPTGDIHRFKVVSDSKDVMMILGNVYFPIKDKMELDMVSIIKEWGYEDVMKHIWFCHAPLKSGKPCGFCRPCAEKMESDMLFLLDEKAQNRCKLVKKFGDQPWFKVYRKVFVHMFCVRRQR